MNFAEWCEKNGIDVDTLNPVQMSAMRAMWERAHGRPQVDPERLNFRTGELDATDDGGAFYYADDGEWKYFAPATIALEADAVIDLEAADDEGKPKLPTFKMLAYTGGAMRLAGWYWPVVIEVSGLAIGGKQKPALLQHDPRAVVGHTTTVEKSNNRVTAEGLVSGTGEAAAEVVGAAKNGFPWRVSVGARAERMEFVESGKDATANGKTWKGPVLIARKATLGEFSFVAIAADDKTRARVAASAIPAQRVASPDQRRKPMTFEQWLKAKGFDTVETMSEEGQAFLRAQYDAEIAAADGGEPTPAPTPAAAPKSPAEPAATEPDVQAMVQQGIRAEGERRDLIEATCRGFEGERIEELRAQAIAGTITVDDLRASVLEHVRTERAQVTPGGADADNTRKMLLATGYLQAAMPQDSIVAICGEPALEAAANLRGVGFQEFCAMAAAIDGVELPRYQQDPTAWLQAAFSTLSLSGILGNVANKSLLAGFNAVEDSWRAIAATRPVKDFKQVTSYRLTGNMEFDQVGPTGELKHGTVGSESYTNQADTYGRMYAITRTDIINDDLGALTAVPTKIGRGAALKLNTVFWTAFLNNGSFFTSGRGNYISGAATALSVNALTTAETAFYDQTDPDGDPVAIAPKILLVPNALIVTATQLAQSVELRDTTASTKYLTKNPHAGNFTPVRSSYLSNSGITGYSTAAWYLLAAPGDMPVIEVVFLNGQQNPVVERADADFNVLGVQFRGYFDFGVSLQEYRGGLKSKGSA